MIYDKQETASIVPMLGRNPNSASVASNIVYNKCGLLAVVFNNLKKNYEICS